MYKYQLSKDSIFGYSFSSNEYIKEENMIEIIIKEFFKINEFNDLKIVDSLIKNDSRFKRVPDSDKSKKHDYKIIMINDHDIISFNIIKSNSIIVKGFQ